MKRMKETDAKELFAFVSDRMNIESIPLDDYKTYELLSNGDTDGVYMMESNWDKYDLLQIKPKNFEELIACVAFSHNLLLNPYIYTYLKMKEVHPFTYPIYTKIEYAESVLEETHGLMVYQHQATLMGVGAYIGIDAEADGCHLVFSGCNLVDDFQFGNALYVETEDVLVNAELDFPIAFSYACKDDFIGWEASFEHLLDFAS